MSRTPRRPRPSALDGYSRLARLGVPARPPALDAAEHVAPRRRRRRSWRFVGGLRFLGLACVLAVVVGASIGLASADPRQSPRGERDGDRVDAAQALTGIAATKVKPDATPSSAEDAQGAEASEAVEPSSTPTQAPATAPAARTTPPVASAAATGALPFTGDRTVELTMLGGALLIMLGMAAQVAGQPLPARAHARRARQTH
jgi:hypothetical protein